MDKSLIIEIKKIDNLILRKLLSYSKEISNVPLSPVQIAIIKYLNDNKNNHIYQKDIEQFIQNRKSTISSILDTMQKNNIIERINSKEDLRSKEIKLTEKGINISNKIEEHKELFDKTISNNINENDLNIFYKVMNQIENNLKGEDNDKAD